MRLLLGSGGFRGEERKELLVGAMRSFFGDIQELLFMPFAGDDGDLYVRRMTELGYHVGYQLVGLHRSADAHAAIKKAQGIYVGGGNSFRLIDRLHRLDLVDLVRRRVVQEGLPYMGVSAGTNVACPTMQTTNDMPIVQPPSFQAFGLVPFQINAHYYPGNVFFQQADGSFHEHHGETREDRIREFHQCEETPVLGLYEGTWLQREDASLVLHGGPARWFQKGADPTDFAAGSDLSALLTG